MCFKVSAFNAYKYYLNILYSIENGNQFSSFKIDACMYT